MDKQLVLILGGCGVLIVGLLVAMVFLINGFDKECQKLGGHTVSHSSNAIGFTTGGQMTFTPNIDVKCYSQDGRLLIQ